MTDTTEVERMDPRCDAGGRGYMLWMEYRDDGGYVRATDYDTLAAKLAEAEAQNENQIAMIRQADKRGDYWKARADAAEAALPAVYRLAMGDAAEKAERYGASPELNVANGGPEWFRHGKSIAKALRKEPTPTAAELMARIQTGEKE